MYISSRSAKDCAATEKELNALGPGKCVAIPADMQKLEEVEKELLTMAKAAADVKTESVSVEKKWHDAVVGPHGTTLNAYVILLSTANIVPEYHQQDHRRG